MLQKILDKVAGIAAVAVFLLCGFKPVYRVEPEIHLIPLGYRGPIVIFFDRPEGKPPEYEDGARIYRIPDDGILFTQMKPLDDEWRPEEAVRHYYVDDNGRRIRILWAYRPDLMNDTVSPYIFSQKVGSASHKKSKQPFESYIVGTRADNTDSMAIKQFKWMDKWHAKE